MPQGSEPEMTPEQQAEAKSYLRGRIRRAEALRSEGIDQKMLYAIAPPGPAGFVDRFAAFITDRECPCGGEHLESDHAELERLGEL